MQSGFQLQFEAQFYLFPCYRYNSLTIAFILNEILKSLCVFIFDWLHLHSNNVILFFIPRCQMLFPVFIQDQCPFFFPRNSKESILACWYFFPIYNNWFWELNSSSIVGTCYPYFIIRNKASPNYSFSYSGE